MKKTIFQRVLGAFCLASIFAMIGVAGGFAVGALTFIQALVINLVLFGINNIALNVLTD